MFFRCPCTELIGKFVTMAKKMNKKVIYDVDDLVIDTVIYRSDYLCSENEFKTDKAAYDANVRKYGTFVEEV